MAMKLQSRTLTTQPKMTLGGFTPKHWLAIVAQFLPLLAANTGGITHRFVVLPPFLYLDLRFETIPESFHGEAFVFTYPTCKVGVFTLVGLRGEWLRKLRWPLQRPLQRRQLLAERHVMCLRPHKIQVYV